MTNKTLKPSSFALSATGTIPLGAPHRAATGTAGLWTVSPEAANWSVSTTVPLPDSYGQASTLYESALTSAAMSFHEAAIETLQDLVSLAPDHAAGWQELTGLLRLAARDAEADDAQKKYAALAATASLWQQAAGERSPSRLDRLDKTLAARLDKIEDEDRADHLRTRLLADPLDTVAMRALAREETAAGDIITATRLLDRATSLSPTYLAARLDLIRLLKLRRNYPAIMRQTDHLLAEDAGNLAYRLIRGDAALHIERFDEAVTLFEGILEEEPENPQVQLFYGNVLKTLGRREESVRAYRALLAVEPASGSAYFGLSELKAGYLQDIDIVAMRAHLARGIASAANRKFMAYALGQTLERACDYKSSFDAYACGANACKEEVAGTDHAYDPLKFEQRLARMRGAFTAEIMSARAALPASRPAVTPIFIIGLPRSGSTLVEQILASHSLVEGTRELPIVSNLTKRIAMSRMLVNPDVYPERVLELDRAELNAIGEECLQGIAEYRKTSLPHVIDKRPWNWIDAAFIHLILPQAKFIDIRRAPMAAGFAMFKQLLPPVAAFTYDLAHLGHYYRSYAGFMTHLDTIMPGQILRVSYEDLVCDTETQIRRILGHCGLSFEETCLRYWEQDRAIMTPSAEQVRRPIFHDALHQWKNYEPWLGSLRDALGELAEN